MGRLARASRNILAPVNGSTPLYPASLPQRNEALTAEALDALLAELHSYQTFH